MSEKQNHKKWAAFAFGRTYLHQTFTLYALIRFFILWVTPYFFNPCSFGIKSFDIVWNAKVTTYSTCKLLPCCILSYNLFKKYTNVFTPLTNIANIHNIGTFIRISNRLTNCAKYSSIYGQYTESFGTDIIWVPT